MAVGTEVSDEVLVVVKERKSYFGFAKGDGDVERCEVWLETLGIVDSGFQTEEGFDCRYMTGAYGTMKWGVATFAAVGV
jgi:hypothetical protein